MDSYPRRAEKRRCSSDFEEDLSDDYTTTSTTSTGTNTSGKNQPTTKGPVMETEKRMRREIANSNERRRMQSINAGFQSLKTLLPHQDGEKLSKAAILQQTTEYISAVDSEKRRLVAQNEQLKRMIADLTRENGQQTSPQPKRKKRDTECSDEGIGGMSAGETEDQSVEELKGEIVNLRVQVERERRLRIALEERNRDLEERLYPTKLTTHVQAQIRYQDHMPQKVTELNEEPSVRKAPEPEPQLPPQQVPQQLTPPAPVVKSEPVLTTIPQPRAHIPSMNPAATSMSRRNLETIVEAIRHLEGDSMLFDSFKKPTDSSRDIPHSEGESEKESSMYSDEEIKSESSGRESPPLFKPHHTTTATATLHVRQEAIPVHHVSATAVAATAAPQFVSSERYPIATQLLHRPTTLQQPFVHRPGVIVQNLS